MIVAYRRDRTPVYCRDIKADGAMTVLLKDAMQPNLVQTLENNPAFVHGGPFANIAHGCNSVIATKTALKLADYVVTEAGFGADLGAEKFMNIKCRKAGLAPDCVVLVATVRAMKMNGGVAKADLGAENVDAVKAGCANLGRHIENVKSFGVPVVVAINHFVTDTEAEVAAVKDYVAEQGAEAILCKHWAEGSEGIEDLATQGRRDGRKRARRNSRRSIPTRCPVREDRDHRQAHLPRRRGAGRQEDPRPAEALGRAGLWQPAGLHGQDAVFSFSTDPNLRGAPTGHSVPVREVRLSAGAGFVVVICGEIMTMPGLPRVPSAEAIRLNAEARSKGCSAGGGGACRARGPRRLERGIDPGPPPRRRRIAPAMAKVF
jgi:formate--tetrahydrofolate ligase